MGNSCWIPKSTFDLTPFENFSIVYVNYDSTLFQIVKMKLTKTLILKNHFRRASNNESRM